MTVKTTNISAKELREFGLLFGGIFAGLFGLLLPWLTGKSFPLWPWWVLAVSVSLAVIYPLGLKPFYRLWMLFGSLMGWLNTRIILGLVFYIIFMPFGFMIRLLGKDPLSRKLDKESDTYRINNKHETENNMEKPF